MSELTTDGLTALAPYLAMTAGLIAVMLVIAARRSHSIALASTVAVLLISMALIPLAAEAGAHEFDNFVRVDTVAHFFSMLFLLAAVVVSILSYGYLGQQSQHSEEFYLLIITATLGAMVMAAATHFAAFLLGLEIVSISLYTLIAYPDESHRPLEASIKYLILSAVASTTILFGMALVYATTGTLEFVSAVSDDAPGNLAYFTVGQMFLWVGLAFKLSLVPFHMWTPDVYQGATAPVTGFIATVSKGAVLALLIRLALDTDVLQSKPIFVVLSIVAVLSMVVGNLLALMQRNLKRILAYSSIAHIGYLMIAILLVGVVPAAEVIEAVMLYLVAYFLMTLAAFGVITARSSNSSQSDVEDLDDYAGLFWSHPIAAAVLTVAALSLAGIPLTMGFIAKFYIFSGGIEGQLWILVWALVVGSAIGIYYYLRIVYSMTQTARADRTPVQGKRWEAITTVSALGVALVVLGIYPTALIGLVQNVIQSAGF